MRKTILGALVVMMIAMLCIGYIPKSSSAWWSIGLLGIWIASFYYLLLDVKKWGDLSEIDRNKNIRLAVIGGIVLRGLLLFAIPKWASDLYRILWDAKVQAIGFNPYSVTPKELMDRGLNTFSNAGNIYHQLRDVHAYTTNGPLYEWIALIAVKLSLGKDWVMTSIFRLIIIMLDIISVMSVLKWQQSNKISLKSLMHYLLNPFLVFSIALYAPSWALAFALLIFAYQLLLQKRMLRSGIVYILAVAANPLSLFALPVLFVHASRKTIIKTSIVVLIFGISIYLPYFRTGDIRHNLIAEWMHDLLFYPGGGVLQGYAFINPIFPAIGLGIAILAWLIMYVRSLVKSKHTDVETASMQLFETAMKWAFLLPVAVLIAWVLEASV